MSGGNFDYEQYRIEQAADEVASYIRKCESDEADEYGYKPSFSADAIRRFRECESTLRRAAAMLQRVDWLASSDDDEATFHERWDEEVPWFPTTVDGVYICVGDTVYVRKNVIRERKVVEIRRGAICVQVGHIVATRDTVSPNIIFSTREAAEVNDSAPCTTWACGCGILNHVSLATCRVCGRREGVT